MKPCASEVSCPPASPIALPGLFRQSMEVRVSVFPWTAKEAKRGDKPEGDDVKGGKFGKTLKSRHLFRFRL